MDVKTIAVSLPVSGDLTLEGFLDYLRQEPLDLTNPLYNEALVVDRLQTSDKDLQHLWVGFLLSRRTQRVIPLMKIIGKMLEITPLELEQGTNKIDVNCFLINPNSQKGLFQTYWDAPRFSGFAGTLSYKFLLFRSIHRSEAIFLPKEIVKHDSLKQWLSRVEEIQQIIYEFEEVKERATTWGLLGVNASSETVKLVYRRHKLQWRAIKESLERFVEQHYFKKMVIQGKTENKLDKYFDLFENKDVVHMQDFDEYARGLSFKGEDLTASLHSSPNIKSLAKLYKTNNIRRVVDAIKEDV